MAFLEPLPTECPNGCDAGFIHVTNEVCVREVTILEGSVFYIHQDGEYPGGFRESIVCVKCREGIECSPDDYVMAGEDEDIDAAYEALIAE